MLFQKRLDALIEAMHKSIVHWVLAAYKANPPKMAEDELPYATLRRLMKKLARQWEKKFDEGAPKLAEWFAQAANQRSKKQLQQILKDAGFAIDFKMSAPVRDALQATIAEQVALIKSIPSQHFTQIEGMVMRSVAKGGDMKTLSKGLSNQFGVTKRRAAFIARDQNSKAIATMTRARQLQAGITEAVWLHSHAGKEPRPTHLAMSGKKYDVAKGWFDPDAHGKGKGAWIHPGELINCRCVSRSVIPGL